jgi:protein O-mannosyl-transferase
LLFGLGCFVVTLFPVSGFFHQRAHLHTFVADHWLYHSIAGVIALVVAGGVEICRRLGKRGRSVGMVAGVCVLALLAASTWKRAGIYTENVTLWRDNVARNPAPFPHNLLGCALEQAGKFDEAIREFQAALQIDPDYFEAHSNLGNTLSEAGNVSEAIRQWREALRLNPRAERAHNNLGSALQRRGQLAEAREHFEQAVRLMPDYAEAHNNLGIVLLRKGQPDEKVMIQFQEALKLNPDYAEAHYNLGAVFGVRGRLDEAVEQYRKAIQLKPDYADARGNLANVLATQGKFDEAVKAYQQALELVPKSAQAHFRFGQALQGQRNFEAAMKEYQKALDLAPQHLSAHLSLAWLLATCPETSLRDGQKAVELAQQAERLGGGESPQMLDTLAAAYAEAGRFGEAVKTARQALSLPATQNNQPLAEAIQARLKLYEAGSPFHEKP